MIVYSLFYHYGQHSIVIDVSQGDFFKVFDDLSKEFEIVKKEYSDGIDYFLINYLGENDMIGYQRSR